MLDAVARLPVSTWRCTWEPEGVRHLDPMAQDWHAAFHLGSSDRRIDVVDAFGVAVVCIQALERRITQLPEDLHTRRLQLREPTAPQHAQTDSGAPKGRAQGAPAVGSG
ncbi:MULTISPECIES: hypothetical protein [Streptomyces]|uniref:Peptidase S74 domain-containing protein n=1 Tax=Streptomyces tricolor TaxID=68277 RepID=A0ABS9J8R4_9ACTN|nr:hypothetical protein [Streptomyces tricolor]MCG0061946.1 hypothetical protein [Streptomyces tricolor]